MCSAMARRMTPGWISNTSVTSVPQGYLGSRLSNQPAVLILQRPKPLRFRHLGEPGLAIPTEHDRILERLAYRLESDLRQRLRRDAPLDVDGELKIQDSVDTHSYLQWVGQFQVGLHDVNGVR